MRADASTRPTRTLKRKMNAYGNRMTCSFGEGREGLIIDGLGPPHIPLSGHLSQNSVSARFRPALVGDELAAHDRADHEVQRLEWAAMRSVGRLSNVSDGRAATSPADLAKGVTCGRGEGAIAVSPDAARRIFFYRPMSGIAGEPKA